jgi:thiamine-phosphate pyrophosphorylase
MEKPPPSPKLQSDRYHESRSGNPIGLRDFGPMRADHEARRDRLARARLYLVCDRRPAEFLRAALAGGVDLLQLRDKTATDDDLRAAAETFRRCCDEAGALFLLNDRPDLAVASGADGVHLGQDDMEPARAREIVGDGLIVGRSTHSAAQVDAATGVDYIAVGPVHATPTKPGRPAVGLEPIRHAAARARVPWFAIGGLDAGNVDEVIEAGARRIVVVRAITEAADPRAAAAALRGALDRAETGVGVGPA